MNCEIKMKPVTLSNKAVMDLLRIKAEFDSVVESIELMSDEKFMHSFAKSKEQIAGGDFDDWKKL